MQVGPRKYEKIQKKYKNGHFWAIFVFFLYFFVFLGPEPGWGIS